MTQNNSDEFMNLAKGLQKKNYVAINVHLNNVSCFGY